MKKLLVGVFSVFLVLAACGGGGDDGGENGDTGNEESGQEQDGGTDEGGTDEGTEGDAGGDTAQAGEQLYQNNCAQCHGGDLNGANGPSLQNAGDDYDIDEIVGIIQNGQGAMPAQDVNDEDANTIAEWLVNQ
ncbi:c-type cytochrome [Aquisalibacillus elongatus]|uniref:Cytochrome c551 n=1 Tax=Aquisalibacillus elongatus TaxID=485577 RepID=A0A3N5CBW1_9BACI|nr:cytochrome c [Aquisalibacillus elongatus]RPF54371.1 cytochrome c551 [Aquisalibacillus elongatus]